MRVSKVLILSAVMATLWSGQAWAGAYTVNASGGGSCGSGSFSPNSGNLTVQSGESVTVHFNVSEPTYPAGWDLTSSLWGTVHADSGASVDTHFTAPAAGSYSYQGTWPSNGCQKASATITVTAVTPPPPPAVQPPPPPPPPPATSGAQKATPPAAQPPPPPVLPPGATVIDDTNLPNTDKAPALQDQPKSTAKPTNEAKALVSTSVLIGGGGVLALGGLAAIIFHLLKLHAAKP